MAIYGKLLREQAGAAADQDKHDRALKCDRDMIAVAFEWHTNQSDKAVLFPSYGWVPAVAIRWRKSNGAIVPWLNGRATDTLLIAREFVERAKVKA